jgi:hypothetical protein
MPEEVDVACPSCNAVFSVPLEFCGETAQCAECDTVFEIPLAEEGAEGQLLSTDTGAIKTDADAEEATNTVRLSRTGIGMIPQVKDSFSFGGDAPAAPTPAPKPVKKPSLAKSPTPAAPPPATPAAPPSPNAEKFAPPEPKEAPAPTPKQEKIMVPSWTKIRMKKDEEVLGLKEHSTSPIGMAIVAAIIAAVCGGAGMGLANNTPVAAVLIVILAGASFAAVFFMAKGASKAALILTSLRSICVIGSKRLEITK